MQVTLTLSTPGEKKSLTSHSFDFPSKISTINKKWRDAEQNLDQIESMLESCRRDNKYDILAIRRSQWKLPRHWVCQKNTKILAVIPSFVSLQVVTVMRVYGARIRTTCTDIGPVRYRRLAYDICTARVCMRATILTRCLKIKEGTEWRPSVFSFEWYALRGVFKAEVLFRNTLLFFSPNSLLWECDKSSRWLA